MLQPGSQALETIHEMKTEGPIESTLPRSASEASVSSPLNEGKTSTPEISHDTASKIPTISSPTGSPRSVRKQAGALVATTRPPASSKLSVSQTADELPPLARARLGSALLLLSEHEALSERTKELAAAKASAEGAVVYDKVPFRLDIEEAIDAHFRGTFISKCIMRTR